MTDSSPTPSAVNAVPAKQQQLIQTAFALFYRDSIHGVGINQILQEAGIAKKTLYHHFASKDELVLAVLAYRDEVFLTGLNNVSAAPAAQKIRCSTGLPLWMTGSITVWPSYRNSAVVFLCTAPPNLPTLPIRFISTVRNIKPALSAC